MSKIKVGVVRGGPSSEYDISIKTGGEVLKHLPEKYSGVDVLLSKNNEWHLNGFPKTQLQVFDFIDVFFNALHGEFGEDGKAQQIFDSFNAPYTGSQIVPSSLAMKKHLSRDVFLNAGLKIPQAVIFKNDNFFGVDVNNLAEKVFNSSSPPWVIKPASTGSSLGISICKSFAELAEGIRNAFAYGDTIIVEEYIKGREATCGVLEGFRGEQCYPLPVVEIIPPAGNFFDYQVKYDGSTNEICPAGFDDIAKREIENMAVRAHQALGCRHYSRADFIISDESLSAGRQGIYLLEVNTLPGLTSESLFPKAASAAGLEFPQLLDHLIKLALSN